MPNKFLELTGWAWGSSSSLSSGSFWNRKLSGCCFWVLGGEILVLVSKGVYPRYYVQTVSQMCQNYRTGRGTIGIYGESEQEKYSTITFLWHLWCLMVLILDWTQNPPWETSWGFKSLLRQKFPARENSAHLQFTACGGKFGESWMVNRKSDIHRSVLGINAV